MTNDISYLASGFQEDCSHLLELFKSNSNIRFDAFCKAWQEMKFPLVFLCRKNYAELLEFCEETLHIAKQFILLSNELIDQIGALYLLYGLYYKIPVENVKIRVTAKEWQKFLEFHKIIKIEKLYDASYIFVKLVTDNAFHHCLFATEYGLEKIFKSRQEHSFDNPHSVLTNIVDEIGNGELSQIQKLCNIYEDEKEKLLHNMSSQNKLELFDRNFMDEIVSHVETLQDKRQTLTGLRSKVKDINIHTKSSKTKYNYDNKIRPKLGHGFDTDSSDDESMDMQFAFVKTDNSNPPKTFDNSDGDDLIEKNENSNESKREDFIEDEDYNLNELVVSMRVVGQNFYS